MELALLLPSLILGFLLWQEKRDRALERKERDLKEIGLLNRIQAPEAAPWIDPGEIAVTKAYVGFDNDEEFWAAKEDERKLNGDG